MDLALGNLSISIKSGALIPVLLMFPNVVWLLLPKTDTGQQVAGPLLLRILENVGRVAVFVLPFLYSLDLNKKHSSLVMVVIGLALTLYYASWIRYFVGDRESELLRAPFLGLPLPLAVAPVILLALSSYLMGSWFMLGASLLFGIAHIWVSALTL